MPTLIHNPSRYVVEFSAQELTTVGRALALMAGYKVNCRGEDRYKAKELNEQILLLRKRELEHEQKAVNRALEKISEDGCNEPPSSAPIE